MNDHEERTFNCKLSINFYDARRVGSRDRRGTMAAGVGWRCASRHFVNSISLSVPLPAHELNSHIDPGPVSPRLFLLARLSIRNFPERGFETLIVIHETDEGGGTGRGGGKGTKTGKTEQQARLWLSPLVRHAFASLHVAGIAD